MISPARAVALDVTTAVRSEDAFANLALPAAISKRRLDPRDAAHATDLTFGTARWRGFIDAVLVRCVSRPLADLDGLVLDLLRVGVYELVVSASPPHVVNEWVEVAKRRVARASGLVNAALRKASAHTVDEWLARFRVELAGDALLEATTSHPAWIVRSFGSLLPSSELDALIAADNAPPHPMLIALPGVANVPENAQRATLSPYAFHAPPGPLSAVAGIADGSVRVQDEGSQLAALMLAAVAPIDRGERWLDLCAGPGGKTALLASLVSVHEGTVVANEPHEHRAELVRRAIAPFASHVSVVTGDGRAFAQSSPAGFDRILVDAPCSGLGALRRRPESRWRKRESDLVELVELQTELLLAAAQAVSVGGVIAYVTCSPDSRETVDVINNVCAQNLALEKLDSVDVLNRIAPNIQGAKRGTAVQLWPHRHGTDAMFIQLLRRTR